MIRCLALRDIFNLRESRYREDLVLWLSEAGIHSDFGTALDSAKVNNMTFRSAQFNVEQIKAFENKFGGLIHYKFSNIL